MFVLRLGLLFLLLPILSFSQNLTGIWKGYFTTGLGEDRRTYKYEMQLHGSSGSHLSGISYSYMNTSFFGKSEVEGDFTTSNKSLDIKEVVLVHVKGASKESVCMMHCHFRYFKLKNEERLEGTYTSHNLQTNEDCGQGYIYLERSIKSDFHKEDFLAKTKPAQKKVLKKKTEETSNSKTNSIATTTTKTKTNPKPVLPIQKDAKEPVKLATTPEVLTANKEKVIEKTDSPTTVENAFANIPSSFMKRKNKIIKTIITHTPEVDISFYDNGEIDDDSITVYHNMNRIIEHGRLSRQAINYGFDASTEEPNHSIIIVADNLGKIPPNSVLMVIYTNKQRYEVFIESDMANNGEVRIIYQPQEPEKN